MSNNQTRYKFVINFYFLSNFLFKIPIILISTHKIPINVKLFLIKK